jgi:DNA transposition AAA+ family ATPase
MESVIELTPPRESAIELSPDVAEISSQRAGHNSRSTWQFSLPEIRPAIADYSPLAKEKLIAAFLWCTNPLHPVSKPEFAERVGTTDNTLWKIYKGKYFHPVDRDRRLQPSEDLISRITQFLAIEKRRFEAGSNEFVVTPTVRLIAQDCELARESQTICTIEGPSHVGKSMGATHYATTHDNTRFTEMPGVGGYGDLIRAMAVSAGLSPNGGNVSYIYDAIINATNQDMVWIFDEVSILSHTCSKHIFFKCIEALRRLHDRTKCGMVWIFTDIKDFKFAAKAELQQAWRRGVHKRVLPSMIPIADITAIVEHNGLKFPDAQLVAQVHYHDKGGKVQTISESPRAILRELATSDGLLAITERLRYAKTLAKKSGGPLDWSHFVEAHLIIVKQSQPQGAWV